MLTGRALSAATLMTEASAGNSATPAVLGANDAGCPGFASAVAGAFAGAFAAGALAGAVAAGAFAGVVLETLLVAAVCACVKAAKRTPRVKMDRSFLMFARLPKINLVLLQMAGRDEKQPTEMSC
jgi:predicted lipid-binding transport protein (Tim44 family)